MDAGKNEQELMMKRICFLAIGFFSIINLFSSPAEPQQDQGIHQNVSLAIIPGNGDRRPSETIVVDLEIEFSHAPHIRLVERKHIQSILDEQFVWSSWGIESKEAIHAGRLLFADLLLFVEKVPGAPSSLLQIRIVETKTGIILTSLLEEETAFKEDQQSLLQAVDLAIEKHAIAPQNRYWFGILGFRNQTPGSQLDGVVEALKMFLMADLGSIPNIIVLDREHVQHLSDEAALTSTTLALRSSVYLLEAELKYAPWGKDLEVIMVMRPLVGGSPHQMTLKLPAKDYSQARKILSQAVLDYLHLRPLPEPNLDPQEEVSLFIKRVPWLLANGQYEEAIRYAEVAYALWPNQETRYWVARTWYALGWTLPQNLAYYPGEYTPGRMKRIPVRIVGTSDEEYAADLRRFEEKEKTELQALSKKKERYLVAFLRAYNMMYELSRFHAQDYEQRRQKDVMIPDPTGDLPLPPESSYRKTGLMIPTRYDQRSEVPIRVDATDVFEVRKLYEQLIQVKEALLLFEEKYYSKYQGKGSQGFWEMFRKKKEHVEQHYRGQADQTVPLIKEAVDAFAND